MVASFGGRADEVYLLAHGRVEKVGTGPYGDDAVLGVLADGAYFGDQALLDGDAIWEYTARTVTACTVLVLPRQAVETDRGAVRLPARAPGAPALPPGAAHQQAR
ncbi:hypothetical protein STENM223S_04733 [Streptomyces tendae]